MKTNNNLPLVSVIIPTYNRAYLIEQAIYSVLNQTYPNIELIIVDDASNDNTESIIKNFNDARISCIKQKQHAGAAAARNKGILESRGEFISFLDSDDTINPEKIQKQVNAILNADEDVAAVYCGLNLIDFKTKEIIGQSIHKKNFYNNFKNGKFILTPTTGTILARKDAIVDIGGFDERLPAHQDTELAIRFCQKYNYLLLEEFLVNAVKNHDQISSVSKNHIKGKEIIFEKHKKFLSKHILYGLCKQIANYYIISGNSSKAIFYIKEALKLKPFKLLTLFQIILITFFPKYLRNLSKWKQ